MKLSIFTLATLAGAAFGFVLPRDVNSTLVPDFGIPQNNQPSATTGDCLGASGKRIPCACPPSKAAFLAVLDQNVNAGGLKFPTDASKASTCIRANTMVATLQQLKCPAVSAPNLAALQKQNC